MLKTLAFLAVVYIAWHAETKPAQAKLIEVVTTKATDGTQYVCYSTWADNFQSVRCVR